MSEINHKLYTAAQVRGLDNAAIREFDIAGYELMSRAGRAVLKAIGDYFPRAGHWLIMCGPGNNGGDGYVVARLAAAAGIEVTVCSLVRPERLRGDAGTAYRDWREIGETLNWSDVEGNDCHYDLIVDGLLGTGIERAVEGDFRSAINFINAAKAPVVALDIPSGLNADSGCEMGVAVHAQLSVSFVGRKRGMYTADGRDHCGHVVFDDLGIPEAVTQYIADSGSIGELLCAAFLSSVIKPRAGNSHKGTFGEVLGVGGASGMGGAILLCGEAALRSGAGKVRLATHPEHAGWVAVRRPELMVSALNDGVSLTKWLKAPRVLALGPGLGRNDWSKSLLQACFSSDLKMVIDADALNLLAELSVSLQDMPRTERILTPHPAEAARLLDTSTAEIQSQRINSAQLLADRYQAVVVLKGSGTVIACPDGDYAICPFGNPGMATAGSGDVLTGIIAALLAQGLDARDAACAGVLAHALAGDLAAEETGEVSMIAGDITGQLQHIWKAASLAEESN